MQLARVEPLLFLPECIAVMTRKTGTLRQQQNISERFMAMSFQAKFAVTYVYVHTHVHTYRAVNANCACV